MQSSEREIPGSQGPPKLEFRIHNNNNDDILVLTLFSSCFQLGFTLFSTYILGFSTFFRLTMVRRILQRKKSFPQRKDGNMHGDLWGERFPSCFGG